MYDVSIILLSEALCCTVQRGTAKHSTVHGRIAQHSTRQDSTGQHSTVQYSTAQHSIKNERHVLTWMTYWGGSESAHGPGSSVQGPTQSASIRSQANSPYLTSPQLIKSSCLVSSRQNLDRHS